MKKILIVLLNVVIIFTFVGLNFNTSFASEGTISAPSSVTLGESFTVKVVIPSDAVGYQGEISVKFGDNSVQNSGNLAVVTGITGDYAHPGNMQYSFSATAEGTAVVTVSNLKITDKNANRINSQTTLTASVSVVKKPETTTPSQPTTPSTSTTTTPSTSTTTIPTTPTTPTPTTPATTTPTSNEPSWTNAGDTVYATERVNVRSGWGTSYSAIGKLAKGDSVTRNAKGSNGWDKISYNGQTGYVLSQYLTTQNPNPTENTVVNNVTDNTATDEPSWTNTGDTVYATTGINVRKGWGTNFESIGSLAKGDSAARIAVGSNGWDKIKYKGNTAYVMSKLVSTEKPEMDEESISDENNEVANNTVNTNVTTNELDVYNQLIEEVGVLPTVGRNFADYVYLVAVCGAIVMIAFVGVKIREKNEE